MYVGKNVPHDSARGHVTGESVYVDDIPHLANELQVGYWWSPVARGRIRALDLAAAAMIPGVVALYTFEDIEGGNIFGPIFQDEPLLAPGEVSYIGQPVVVIAAETREAVDAARKAIVADIERLTPILTIDDAVAAQSFIGTRRTISRGNAEAAIAAAPHVVEGVFRSGGQDQFYLESQAAIAMPDEHGAITVHSSTQNPTEVQDVIAHVLGLSQSEVVVVAKRMGGGFGGKECQATHPATIAALVAQKTRRPARIAFTKDEDMIVTGHRHPFQNRYRVGFDDSGHILGMQVDFYSDGGAFADLSTAIMARAMCHAENAYYIHDIEINGTVCRTNSAPNTAMRGFGGPQGVATMENMVEEIAVTLGRDPFEIRRLNCYGTTDRNVTPYGAVVENNTLPRIFDELVASSDYVRRRDEVLRFNRESKTRLRGIALTPVKFGISFNTTFLNQANALVNIYRDGSVQVSTGATEMGQGVNTKIAQLVADELGVELSAVRLMITSTEKNNNTSATAASTGSDINGAAAIDACRRLRARLADCAARLLVEGEADPSPSPESIVVREGVVFDSRRPAKTMTFGDLAHAAHRHRVSLGERGYYATPLIHWDIEKFSGRPFLYYTIGAAVSEVEIDRFTGMMRVLRSDLLMDIGRSINPGIDRGQITGAFVQGMGWCTTEELRYADDGELLTHSPTTYKIPNIQDLPEIFSVAWIDNDTNTANVKGSKAVGEPPLLLGISVWAAAKQALLSVAAGRGVPLGLPATIEEIAVQLATIESV
ncbi:MAG: xanthine dehydrogenase molybdopterin binding subunit [Acidobacteria bacterium]|nr:xanthine dehydrogenase molybdopterin binding subunit [Acidobacteriota bacterium]